MIGIYGFVLLILFLSKIRADQNGNVDDVGDDATDATTIQLATVYSYVLSLGGDVDYFSPYLLSGRTYRVCTEATMTNDIWFYSTDMNTALGANYDVNEPYVDITAPSTGYYYFCISQGTLYGSYRIPYTMYVGDTSACSASCSDCTTVNSGVGHCTSINKCTTCSNGGSSGIIGAHCPCPSTSTVYVSGSCPTCASQMANCGTCSSTTVCTSCTGGKYLYQAACIDTCPTLITYVSGYVCESCSNLDANCGTCNSSISCLSCQNSKVALGATCIDTCIDGTYDNSGLCTSCKTLDNSCELCNSTSTCTHCSGVLVALGSTCITSCPYGTYDETGVCTSCMTLDNSCTSCNASVTCLSCSGGLVALGSTCITSRPTGTYNNSGLCLSCATLDLHCLECSNNLFCSVCDSGYIIYGSTCVSSCPSGFSNNEGICSSKAYKIILSTTSSTYSYLAQYSSALVSDIDVQEMTIIILVDVDTLVYNYTLTKLSSTVYQIDFDNTADIPSTTLKLTYTLTRTTPTTSTLTGRWIAKTTSMYMSHISSANKVIVNYIKKVASTSMTVAAVSATSLALLGGNPALLWPLLTLFQAFYYLIFINVDFPANVQIFLQIFSIGTLDFIPNPLEWFVHNIDEYSLPAPQRFQEYDVDALFLNNAGNELLFLALTIGTYLASKMIKKWTRGLHVGLRKLTNECVDWFEWSGILNSLITSYTDFMQAILLQMRVLSYYSYIYTISSILTFVTLGMALILPFLVFSIIKTYKDYSKFDALVGEYDMKTIFGKYFVPIWLIRRSIMIISLVCLQDYPYVQINMLCLLMAISIFTSWMYCPYSSRKENINNTLTEVLFGMIHAVIYVLLYDDQNPSFSDVQRMNLGWAIIALCGVILTLSLVLNIYEQIQEFRKTYKMLKELFCPQKAKKKIKGTKENDCKETENMNLQTTLSEQRQSQLFDSHSGTRLDISTDRFRSPQTRLNRVHSIQNDRSIDVLRSPPMRMETDYDVNLSRMDSLVSAHGIPKRRIKSRNMNRIIRMHQNHSLDLLPSPAIRIVPRHNNKINPFDDLISTQETPEKRIHQRRFLNRDRSHGSIDIVENPEIRINQRGTRLSVSQARQLRKARIAERVEELREINA